MDASSTTADDALMRAELHRAAEHIRAGRPVAMPTETVYGLAADATDARAVAEVYKVKARPHFDPLIVHLADFEAIPRLVSHWPRAAERLARRFWPGPLTLVLPRTAAVPDIVTAGLDTVAIRMPDHPLALALIRLCGRPLAAPSANRFGRISPTTAAHVRQELGDRIAMVLDGGPCRAGIESTVIALTTEQPTLLRPGATPIEAIEAVIGPLATLTPPGSAPAPGSPGPPGSLGPHATPATAPPSPGMLARHYAPRTPLRLIGPGETAAGADTGPIGLLLPTPCPELDTTPYAAVELLSPGGDLTEAATNLFAAMRRLDEAGLALIHALPAPDEGLGLAINDRLRRAAEK